LVLADTEATGKGANEVIWRRKHGGQCDETPSRVSSPDSIYSTASSTASRVTTRVNSPEGVLDGFKFGCAGVPISPFSSRPQTTTRTSTLKSTASICAGSTSPSDNLITCGTAACASTSEADVRSSSSSLPTIRSHRWGGPLRPCALSRATGGASASVHEGADHNNNNNNNNNNQQQRQQKKKQQRAEDDTLSKACGRERALRAEIACIQAQVQR